MIVIDSWFGRLGNNILQILRSIHFAIINNHNCIKFESHRMLCTREIKINSINSNNSNTSIIKDTFFYLKKKHNIDDPEPYIMKKYFQTYIKPIFKIPLINNNLHNNNEIYVHFRGGDIFSFNPHKAYVQPPLSYYKNIITDYNIVKLVCEDTKNPCINELLKQENVYYTSNTLEKDLSILSNASNLIIGFGTFGFLLYLMNPCLKNLYIPKYFVDELPKGSWGDDIKIHVVELPNYIKVGEWKFNEEQKKIMLEY